ncbi:hypothetical protein C5167_024766 [Papaver somniferum]|uniref:Uncharacterized protein n=1 Tax=Papaver somniferum TaxID=3469 RepID=A0A4Y7JTD1_PAPSO|nr:hypothetical protein C5167_024766 [Papaver somniferum]
MMTKNSVFLFCFFLLAFLNFPLATSSSDTSLDAERDYAEQYQIYQVVTRRFLSLPVYVP